MQALKCSNASNRRYDAPGTQHDRDVEPGADGVRTPGHPTGHLDSQHEAEERPGWGVVPEGTGRTTVTFPNVRSVF